MTAPLAVLTKNSFKVKTRVIIIMYVVADYNLCIIKIATQKGMCVHYTPPLPHLLLFLCSVSWSQFL